MWTVLRDGEPGRVCKSIERLAGLREGRLSNRENKGEEKCQISYGGT